ncbi:hypothetical protein QR98_0019360 [Sarcoptes scabiei]|uniref:Pre-mRNA-splicing factor ISY1-like protein n=1 Tax=Sarcoptes scabiei TaxID=52283 RepID=A0A131ZXT7_SARSC|nr:hypothetical protein QR98_0019360 [Sarcoptes scabiei]
MARNAEKAMTTLARWRASQLEDQTVQRKQRRPYLTSDCTDLRDAQKWRMDIIREISRKVAQIQNAGLGEHRIRDLNDSINRLLRDKKNWEQRIRELGGVDIKSTDRFEISAKELPGSKGYKYFGAAKDLPGVRELLNQETISIPKKTKAELMRTIDADYYGFRDEDDGVILEEEARVQKQELLKMASEKNLNLATVKQRIKLIEDKNNDDVLDDQKDLEEGPKNFVSHVPSIPTQEEIQKELIEKKKRELLEKYVSDEIVESEIETRNILGIN